MFIIVLHQFELLYNLAHGNNPPKKETSTFFITKKTAMAAWISNQKTTHPSKGSRGCEEEGATLRPRGFHPCHGSGWMV